MEHLILKQKQNANDSATISSTDLLNGLIKEDLLLDVLTKFVTLTQLTNDLTTKIDRVEFNRKLIEKLMVLNNIFKINNPIDITCNSSIELNCKENGVVYYDSLNDRLRINTKKGWKTIKLED